MLFLNLFLALEKTYFSLFLISKWKYDTIEVLWRVDIEGPDQVFIFVDVMDGIVSKISSFAWFN